MRTGVALLGLAFGFVSALNWATLCPNPNYDASTGMAVVTLAAAVVCILSTSLSERSDT